jgi:excisionase family DNA binding protein
MRNALRAARKKKPSAKDKAKGKRGAGISATVRGIETPAREAPEADHERGRDAKPDQAPREGRGLGEKKSRKGKLEDTKKPAKDRQWFKVSEVAERLAISTSQVYAWIEQGELTATRFGPQTIRVRVSELERLEREGIE